MLQQVEIRQTGLRIPHWSSGALQEPIFRQIAVDVIPFLLPRHCIPPSENSESRPCRQTDPSWMPRDPSTLSMFTGEE